MTPEYSVEIARDEGPEFRSIHLGMEPRGTIVMDAQDMGPLVKRFWDTEDYEFWVRIAPAALPKLVFELLKEKYTGQIDAVDALRAFCEAHDIVHEFGSWV